MKINFDLIFNFLKEKYREILIIITYIVSFSLIIWQINSKADKRKDLEFDVNLANHQVETIRGIELTEEQLVAEVAAVVAEVENLKAKLPEELKFQDVNKRVAEISQDNGNIFLITNCKITEDSDDNLWKVDISNINGSYEQILNLFAYIADYPIKVSITSVNLNRIFDTVTGNLTLVFYEREQVEG